jgi:hypothetical protein
MMKKYFIFVAALLSGVHLLALQEEPVPSSDSNLLWHSITVIDYKPGTVETAKEIIQKFESASEAAGTPIPETYWLKSGKYDLVVTLELKNGPDDTEGQWSPESVKWWNALVAQEGSEEGARKLQEDYNALVESSVSSVSCKAK